MSYYTRTVTKVFDFEDDKVRVTFRRLKRKDVLETLVADGTELEKSNRLTDLLPHQVVSFDGLMAEGKPVTLAEALEEQYFAPLVRDILRDLLSESKLGDDEKGKSPAPLADTLKESP